MFKILLVEDSLELQEAIPALLGSECQITVAGTLEQAGALLAESEFDLILLDLLLPDGEAFRFCAQLRNVDHLKEIPFIIVTGRLLIDDKVMAFSLGAEDYIVKPFEPREFRARIFQKLNKHSKKRVQEQRQVIGDLCFSLSSQRASIRCKGEEIQIPLTSLEFKLLYYLAQHPEEVLSRDRIIDAVWGENVHILDRTIDSHISNLRKKIPRSAWKLLSVHGEGYRLGREEARKAV